MMWRWPQCGRSTPGCQVGMHSRCTGAAAQVGAAPPARCRLEESANTSLPPADPQILHCPAAAELLHSLWVLETAGIADIRCQLVAEHGQHAEEAQQAQQQDAAQQQAGQQQEPGQQQRSPSPGPAEQQQQQQGDAGGSGGAGARSRSKGRSKSREAPAAADGEAGPSSKGRGRSKSKSKGKGKSKSKSKSKSRTATPAPDAAVMPRGVRLEVVLTQNLQHQLWCAGRESEPVVDCATLLWCHPAGGQRCCSAVLLLRHL